MLDNFLLIPVMTLSVPLFAQYVTLVSPSEMIFRDPEPGVSFRYPANWSFTVHQPFYMQLSISPPPDAPLHDQLKGVVFTDFIPGVASWPRTHFEGVEFGYNNRWAVTEADCRALAKPDGTDNKPLDEATFRNIRYWHATAANAGLGHGMSEDIYTTYVAISKDKGSGGFCLSFDLAESTLNITRDESPQSALTSRQESTIHASLIDILKTVRISAQSSSGLRSSPTEK